MNVADVMGPLIAAAGLWKTVVDDIIDKKQSKLERGVLVVASVIGTAVAVDVWGANPWAPAVAIGPAFVLSGVFMLKQGLTKKGRAEK